MPILVTGATGLVGNNVARKLLDAGTAVRVLVREGSDPRPLAGLDLDTYSGDIRDADAVQRAVRGCRAVVHAAAQVHIGWTGMDSARAINVEGTINIANAARAAGARMIHVSSIDALGIGTREKPVTEETPYTARVPCPYAVTKREAEIAFLAKIDKGLDGIVVNPSYMLGPWDWKPSSGKLLLEVARLKPWFAPRASNDFTSVVDVADAIVTGIDRAVTGDRYILSGEHHTYASAFQILAEVCGHRKPIVKFGPVIMHIGGLYGDAKAKLTGREGDVNSATIRLMRQPHFCSHEKATRELDYHPRGLRTAAQDAWEWFCENEYTSASTT